MRTKLIAKDNPHYLFAQEWVRLGCPSLEYLGEDGTWSNVSGLPNFHKDDKYRFKGDIHHELRLKWINSGKKLLIEIEHNDSFKLVCGEPHWYQSHEYREAKTQPVTQNEIKQEDAGSHYRRKYKVKINSEDIEKGYVEVNLDAARIASIYGITNHMQFFVLKKNLCAGNRGFKDVRRDIGDIKNACDRWIQMMDEDEENNNA
jgi:hypothetical protein